MKDFLRRLSSRKFLLTVAAGLTFYANKQYTELAGTVVTYLLAEGSSDVVASYASNKYAVPAKVEQQTQLISNGDLDFDASPKVIKPGQP
jgi:hypothetical protein